LKKPVKSWRISKRKVHPVRISEPNGLIPFIYHKYLDASAAMMELIRLRKIDDRREKVHRQKLKGDEFSD